MLGEGELKKNSNGDNSDALKVKEENQDNNQDNDPKAENIVNENEKKYEKADINNNKNEKKVENKIDSKPGNEINGVGANVNMGYVQNENISPEKQEEIIEKKIEAEVEAEPEPKIVQQAAVKNDNIENTEYVQLNWEKVKFSSNGYAAKTATIIDDDKYLKFLKETYDIKENFTAGKVNNIYDGYLSKADLIVADCNCDKFCKEGTLKGHPTAYCNGHGQIFILSSENVSVNYGTKGTGGKWTLEEKGDNEYYVDWHS